jgi:hypothetical protein
MSLDETYERAVVTSHVRARSDLTSLNATTGAPTRSPVRPRTGKPGMSARSSTISERETNVTTADISVSDIRNWCDINLSNYSVESTARHMRRPKRMSSITPKEGVKRAIERLRSRFMEQNQKMVRRMKS